MSDVHREAFLSEAQELLADLESVLLELELQPKDGELIQRAFRALHTIKGSGAMFGFDEVARFTHHVETAFDQVRQGRLEVTPELVAVTLSAGDLIRALLNLSEGDADEDQERRAEILKELQDLMPPVQPQAAAAAPVAGPATEQHGFPRRRWSIRFKPFLGLLLKGSNPLLLFRELREMGDLEVRADAAALPELRDLNPTQCYLSWRLTLTTDQGRDTIQGVFIFVEDDCELEIEPADPVCEPGVQPETAHRMPVVARSLLKEPWSQGSLDKRRDPWSAGGDKVSLRVAIERVDRLINFVGELVVVQARLSQLAADSEASEVRVVAEEVERLTAGLRDNAMSMRMLPLKGTFERFRRLVHDLSRELAKPVDLVTEGADTELDKTVIDQLNDPLLHLIRNSMDHGIEPAGDRAAAGKSVSGQIRLRAAYSGANVLISISDDGRGLDAEAIRARAVEKGLVAADARLSESELHSLILAPGFSTAKQVTGLSGRGVGMDVVRRNVESLRGSLEISSRPGAGATVTLRLPLTLAIIDGLLVRIGGAHFVAPVANVLECIELTAAQVRESNGKHLVNVRGELVPYIRLREYFGVPGKRPPIEQILIVESPAGRFGFAVDEVLGDHQTVIKSLGQVYRGVQVISGATILGDGTVALILDAQRLVEKAVQGAHSGSRGDAPTTLSRGPSIQSSLFSRKENKIHVT